jgi:hypothetical protein
VRAEGTVGRKAATGRSGGSSQPARRTRLPDPQAWRTLLAFSCMRRGFGPSRGTRRMSQTAAHLVDRVIPHVPMRQWMRVCQLRLPIPLRVLLAAQPELVTPVQQVVQRVVERHLLDHTGLKSDEGPGGAVTLIQRFGSAANLNIHLHCLGLDGVAGLGDGAGLAGRAGCRRRGGAHAAAAAGGGHHLSHRLRCRCQFQAVQDGDCRPPMRQSGFPQAV